MLTDFLRLPKKKLFRRQSNSKIFPFGFTTRTKVNNNHENFENYFRWEFPEFSIVFSSWWNFSDDSDNMHGIHRILLHETVLEDFSTDLRKDQQLAVRWKANFRELLPLGKLELRESRKTIHEDLGWRVYKVGSGEVCKHIKLSNKRNVIELYLLCMCSSPKMISVA